MRRGLVVPLIDVAIAVEGARALRSVEWEPYALDLLKRAYVAGRIDLVTFEDLVERVLVWSMSK